MAARAGPSCARFILCRTRRVRHRTFTKAQTHGLNALSDIRATRPFARLGMDCDNGAEFINAQLGRDCTDEQIACTRGRVGRQNDHPDVAPKHWSLARRWVGYDRYDTHPPVNPLNARYQGYSLDTNHCWPGVKLGHTGRARSQLERRCDAPQTPSPRVRDAPHGSEAHKAKSRALHAQLDGVKLKPQIDEMLARIPASKVR